ncbi:hypothetical protein D9619_006373 [Psilocybe cf. subviscida]|uniref:Uncharacterized protein n=1 Tax=Psilocybe cf. subviscida TaxID=2480587 RepID=A0A8H5EXC4_9AGAR|nr:hypothetical protein D9619_006373 [Psilocybe cf. subviscida]
MSLVTQTATPPQRRLSTRRGSTTAPDPFGAHNLVNLNPNRTSSSTLTIVRVPSGVSATTPLALNDPPAPPALNQRRLHRKPNPEEKTRVSFAFSSFGAGGSGGGPANQRSSSPSGGPPSPSSSPRLRPSSPHMSGAFGGKPRLTPDQLVDLARQSTVPRLDAPVPHPTPATFTPLPDDIYLPFIERPSEVYSLISSPPDAKLFYILANTFPANLSSPSPTYIAPIEGDEPLDLPRDPADWTYANLIYHLTKVDRDIAPDFVWAVAARKCIISHSELLWERIKGALGVPPELDIDFDFLQDDQESPDTSDISDDEGRAAKGNWSDWDEVMDSPVYARHKRLSVESPSASAYFGKRGEEPESAFRSNLEHRLHGLQDTGYEPTTHESAPTADETGETTIVPTPHGIRSPPEQANHPPSITRREPTLEDGEYLSIEPLIAPAVTSPSGSFGQTLVTSPGLHTPSDGLGDIAEGAEEEEAEVETAQAPADTATAVASSASDHLSPPPPEEGYVSPSQIQGLRICTSPVPPAAQTAANSTPLLSPISPLPPYPSVPLQPSSSASSIKEAKEGSGAQPIPLSRSHSRASSFSSIGPFQRSESTGNLSASWAAAAAAAAGTPGSMVGSWGHILGAHDREGRGSQYAPSVFGSEAGDSSGYMSDGDRLPGNPLFPSNFARLAGGPTMRANHPGTRAPTTLPHTRYVSNAMYAGPSTAHRAGKVRTYSHGASMSGTGPATGGPATVRTQPTGAGANTADPAAAAALARRQTVATRSPRASDA